MMIYRRLITVLCLLPCVLQMAYAADRMPPGSYITKPVATVDDLCGNIQNDPMVLARFQKHFGMSGTQIVSYLRANSKVDRLSKPGRYTEYFVDTRGRLVSHVKYLNVGTPVLVSLAGKPIMDLRCGNPFTKILPKAMAKVETKVAEAVQELTPEPVKPKPEPEPVIEQLPPAPVIQPEPVTQVLAQAPQEITFSPVNIGRGVALLLPLLGAGAVRGSNDIPNTVPEPSSALVLLTGVTGLVAYRRRK